MSSIVKQIDAMCQTIFSTSDAQIRRDAEASLLVMFPTDFVTRKPNAVASFQSPMNAIEAIANCLQLLEKNADTSSYCHVYIGNYMRDIFGSCVHSLSISIEVKRSASNLETSHACW